MHNGFYSDTIQTINIISNFFKMIIAAIYLMYPRKLTKERAFDKSYAFEEVKAVRRRLVKPMSLINLSASPALPG